MQIFCTDTTLLYCDSRFYVQHASLAKRCTAFQMPFGKRAIRFYHVAKVVQKAGMRFLPGYTILCKCNISPFLPHSRMLQNQIRHKCILQTAKHSCWEVAHRKRHTVSKEDILRWQSKISYLPKEDILLCQVSTTSIKSHLGSRRTRQLLRLAGGHWKSPLSRRCAIVM